MGQDVPPPPRPDDLLCYLIHSAGSAFNRVYRKPLDEIGLTYPQYLVMLVLWAGDGLTVGAIGERLRLDSGTLTPLLKRLEAQGLVSRTRSAEDERRVIVALTPRGHALRQRAAEVTQAVSRALGMEPAETAALMAQLDLLRLRLERAAS